MATQATARTEPLHPPLARDLQGNLVAVPDGTAAWRICRQTTGRPKEIIGPDKKALRLPLDTTLEELAELCGADAYRVYALDEFGAVLDFVTTVDVTRDSRNVRNGVPELPVSRASASASTSDLRFALESMAEMMRVNSEALRAVTESQADCFKSISSVRGYFRNAAFPPPTPPNSAVDENTDDDDEYEPEPPPPKSIYDLLSPIVEACAPAVGPLVTMFVAGAGTKASTREPATPQPNNPDLASRPNWEVRDLVDLKYTAAKVKAKKEKAASAEGSQPTSAKQSLQARVMSDPRLMPHFVAIKSLLSPEEGSQLLAVSDRATADDQEWLITKISELPADEAAQMLRLMLPELIATNPIQPANDSTP